MQASEVVALELSCPEAFVACDGYYKKSFFTVVNEDGELTDDCI